MVQQVKDVAKKAARVAVGRSRSPKWTIKEDWGDLLRLALIAAVIAVVTKFTEHDNATVAAVSVVVLEALRKWAADIE